MRQKGFILCCLISVFFIFIAAAQESLTITTYYPAPFGVYTNMRLFPSGQPNCGAANDEGVMYYDNSDNQVMVCGQNASGNFVWQGVGLWTRNGNTIFASDHAWNIGIGTSNPHAKFDVSGGLRIGDDANACVANKAGTMRYRNDGLQYCNGSTATWQSPDSLIKGVASMQVAFSLRNREDIVDHEFVEIELSGANPVLTANKRGSISGGWLKGSFINSTDRTTVVVPPSMVDTDVRVEYWNVTATPPITVTVLNKTKIRIEVWPRGDIEPSTGAGNRGANKGSVRFSVLVLQM